MLVSHFSSKGFDHLVGWVDHQDCLLSSSSSSLESDHWA